MKQRVELGLLHSFSGSYPLIRGARRVTARSAIAQINAEPDIRQQLSAD